MQRRQLLKRLAMLAVAERLSSLRAAWAAGISPATPGLQRFSGQVTVNGQPAKAGMPINPGDTIATGPGSEAIYVIGKDAYLQRDRSVVSISGDVLKAGLRVITGKLLAVFGKGDKRIETATATIGIRGTGCYIESAPDKVYFCLCYGKADIASLHDPAHVESIETRYHDHPVYLHANGSQMMVPATVINHTDNELYLLESLVGRVPPFYGQAQPYSQA